MSYSLRIAAALIAGIIFGFGLSLSGMLDPARVIGFLDIGSGHWDPSLAFVLAGAVTIAVVGVLVMRGMRRPVFDTTFQVPPKGRIDARLILGSAIFGAGWGIAGFCPGPAVAALSLGLPPAILFVAAMLAGMVFHDRFVAARPA